MDKFFKFPSTPHLAWLGKSPIREDKLMTPGEVAEFLKHPLTIEEKIDGANLGISLSPDGDWLFQNRGNWLSPPYDGQWKRLPAWLMRKEAVLQRHLTPGLLLFGEWCYARHSIHYTSLPDFFVGFDIYDQDAECFYSVSRRNELFNQLGLPIVPKIQQDQPIHSLECLKSILNQKSAFTEQSIEGIYLRYDNDGRLVTRAKLVAPHFTQSIQNHWSKSYIIPNGVAYVA